MGIIGLVWGLVGVSALLVFAIVRLSGIAYQAFQLELTGAHWLALGVFALFMAYAEGWRGFHKAFSPRVVARGSYLRREPRPVWVLFAPLFCMCFFHTTRRRQISAYALTIGIVAFISLFQSLAQPWRGILDAGVVVGLVLGVASIALFALRALLGTDFEYSAELPRES